MSRQDGRRMLLATVLIAICPDFDFFFVWILHWGVAWHRAFMHSILFALFLGLIGCALARTFKLRDYLILASAALSHCILDFLTSNIAPGVELFWPFSIRRFNLGLIDYLDLNLSSKHLSVFLPGLAAISLFELAVFGSLFLLVRLYLIRRRRISTREAATPAAEVTQVKA